MSELTKAVYGNQFTSPPGPFGLRCGQMRYNRDQHVAHNGGWYNRHGEKIGWGDLGSYDIEKIMADEENILGDGWFLVIPEMASHWELPKEMDEYAPGIEYVVKHCTYAVQRGLAYAIDPFKPEGYTIGLVRFLPLSRAELAFRLKNTK